MTTTTFTRFAVRLAAGLVAVAGSQAFSATSASADPLCYGATTYVAGVGEHDVPTICLGYNSGTICNYQEFGLAPRVAVTTTVCVPHP